MLTLILSLSLAADPTFTVTPGFTVTRGKPPVELDSLPEIEFKIDPAHLRPEAPAPKAAAKRIEVADGDVKFPYGAHQHHCRFCGADYIHGNENNGRDPHMCPFCNRGPNVIRTAEFPNMRSAPTIRRKANCPQ